MNMLQTLDRCTFQTSRLLEFFSEEELQMQIGFPKEQWPIALLKELIDNAMDACETAGVLPKIEVTVEADRLSVRDYGPGLPMKTLKQSLNYLVRVSDKALYVSPTRGQLGNALKCLWAAPSVAHGEHGYVEVVTRGMIHRIIMTLDRIVQCPHLEHTTSPDGLVKNGTLITLVWPGIASCRRGIPHLFTKPLMSCCSTMPHSIRTPASPTTMLRALASSRAQPRLGGNGAHKIQPPPTGTVSSACER
jgi:DNA topoisomerase VI subunit B